MRIPFRLQSSILPLTQACAGLVMDVEEVRAARSKALATKRKERCCLYLDTNWWIRMREVRFSTKDDDEGHELLDLVQRLVNENALTCPASGVVVEEVLRQTDMQTRLSTAFMMDSLSGGIALASKEQQAIYEVSSWLHESLGMAPGVPPPSESILTCPAYTIVTPSIAITRGPEVVRRVTPVRGKLKRDLCGGLKKDPWWRGGQGGRAPLCFLCSSSRRRSRSPRASREGGAAPLAARRGGGAWKAPATKPRPARGRGPLLELRYAGSAESRAALARSLFDARRFASRSR